MLKKLTTWIFILGTAVGGATLWELSQIAWGRNERYTIIEREGREVGPKGGATVLPRFKLEPPRLPIEVPRVVFDQAVEGDQLVIRTQTLPVADVELLRFDLRHAEKTVKEWDEGWPFFGITLAIAALAAGGLILVIYLTLGAVFRLRAPSE